VTEPEGGADQRPDLGVLLDPERVAAAQRVIASGLPGERLDRLVSYAASLLHAPFAQVSLLSASEQVIAAAHGLELSPETRHGPLEQSLCSVTAASGRPLVVEDAPRHPWVQDLSPVTTGAVGSYLGVVLSDGLGHVLGSVCVYDAAPRTWSAEQLAQLTGVADLIAAELATHADHVHADPSGLRAGLAIDAADLGSFLYDFGAARVQWDDRMGELHGVTRESFDGSLRAYRELVHPEDLDYVLQRLEAARDTCGELSLEYRVVPRAGGTRWVRVRGRVMADMLGTPSRLVGAGYDSSAERGQRDELTRLMETMPAALVRVGHDWRFTYVNARAEVLYGRREDLVGVDLWSALPGTAGSGFEDVYRSVMATREPATVEAYYPPFDKHFEVSIWPDEQGLTLFSQDVTERKLAQLAADRATARLTILAEAGVVLGGNLTPRQVLAVLADLVVPRLAASLSVAVTDAVAGLLRLAPGNDATRLHPVEVRHAAPEQQEQLRALLEALELRTTSDSGVGEAVRTRTARSHPRVPDELMVARAQDADQLATMRALSTSPQYTVPLVAPGGVLGAFTAAGTSDEPLDEVLLRDLGTRAAIALENAMSFAQQNRAATVLQQALLPRNRVLVPEVEVATRYLPASKDALAGGDFFRTVNVGGRLVCALGDVMGHGLASAGRAGQLHGLVAALALQGHGPADLLTQLADGLEELMDLELATLLVCSYDPATRELTSATAGHPPPLLTPTRGEPFYLELEPGPPLGVATMTYSELSCRLEPGTTAVLFSDGLVERRDASLSEGLERLRGAVRERSLTPEGLAEHVLRSMDAYAGSDDDVALLTLRHP
jgi:GAF domain-containing protein